MYIIYNETSYPTKLIRGLLFCNWSVHQITLIVIVENKIPLKEERNDLYY